MSKKQKQRAKRMGRLEIDVPQVLRETSTLREQALRERLQGLVSECVEAEVAERMKEAEKEVVRLSQYAEKLRSAAIMALRGDPKTPTCTEEQATASLNAALEAVLGKNEGEPS